MAAENTKKVLVSEGFFARYRALIMTISVFLLLVISLMAYSTRLSSNVRRNHNEHTFTICFT